MAVKGQTMNCLTSVTIAGTEKLYMFAALVDLIYILFAGPVAIWKNERCKRNPRCRAKLYPKD